VHGFVNSALARHCNAAFEVVGDVL